MEDDTHDKLVLAYLRYFETNEIWERKKTVRTYYKVQQCIREIRDLSDQRNKEIRKTQYARKGKNKARRQ